MDHQRAPDNALRTRQRKRGIQKLSLFEATCQRAELATQITNLARARCRWQALASRCIGRIVVPTHSLHRAGAVRIARIDWALMDVELAKVSVISDRADDSQRDDSGRIGRLLREGEKALGNLVERLLEVGYRSDRIAGLRCTWARLCPHWRLPSTRVRLRERFDAHYCP